MKNLTCSYDKNTLSIKKLENSRYTTLKKYILLENHCFFEEVLMSAKKGASWKQRVCFVRNQRPRSISTTFYDNSMFQGFHLRDFMEGSVWAWGPTSPNTPRCNRVKTFGLCNQ